MNLTPEQYKTLAEWMGYEAEIVKTRGKEPFVEYFGGGGMGEWLGEYTPDSNDTQAFELLRKLMETDTTVICKVQADKYVIGMQVSFTQVTGQTLNLAVCHAVLSLMENES